MIYQVKLMSDKSFNEIFQSNSGHNIVSENGTKTTAGCNGYLFDDPCIAGEATRCSNVMCIWNMSKRNMYGN